MVGIDLGIGRSWVDGDDVSVGAEGDVVAHGDLGAVRVFGEHCVRQVRRLALNHLGVESVKRHVLGFEARLLSLETERNCVVMDVRI